MARLVSAILIAATIAGCGSSDKNAVESDHVFTSEGYEFVTGLQIMRITNMSTGKSVKVLRNYTGGLIALPEGF